ncbi:MAG: hypothetical protein GY863_14785 [bacterium]|nr:hypothetical protein [bacterium]
MKCPKCNHISFDHNEKCPKCKRDLSEVRAKLGFPSYCPLLPTQSGVQKVPSEGSITIEQKSDIKSETTTNTPFADPQDFEGSFGADSTQDDGESDFDFSLAEDSDDLTLDFNDFSSDDSDDGSSPNDLESEIAGSFEEELDLSFDETGDTNMDFNDFSSEESSAEQETIVAGSLEDDLNLSFDDTNETTMDFDGFSSDNTDESTLDFEELSAEDPEESTLDFDEIAADDLEKTSIEIAEQDVDDLRLNFEDSISTDEPDKKDSSELEVMDLDLELDDK